jgi:glucose uptake protein GlcU
MALGFVVYGVTFDSFLWSLFEIVLLTSLGMLFITSMVIMHSAKRQHGKAQGDDIDEHLYPIVKH